MGWQLYRGGTEMGWELYIGGTEMGRHSFKCSTSTAATPMHPTLL